MIFMILIIIIWNSKIFFFIFQVLAWNSNFFMIFIILALSFTIFMIFMILMWNSMIFNILLWFSYGNSKRFMIFFFFLLNYINFKILWFSLGFFFFWFSWFANRILIFERFSLFSNGITWCPWRSWFLVLNSKIVMIFIISSGTL